MPGASSTVREVEKPTRLLLCTFLKNQQEGRRVVVVVVLVVVEVAVALVRGIVVLVPRSS